MLTRLRSTWLAGGGALLLALSLTGIAAGASLVADTGDPLAGTVEPAEETPDTTLTFEDVDGDGVDDDCDDAVVADELVAAAANAEVDANADGVVSVPEAAHSDRIGGPNCNHGGYVSLIARATGEACDDPDAAEDAAQDAADGTADQDDADEDADEDADLGDEDAEESDPEADSDELDEAETPTEGSADPCTEETEETEETESEAAECEAPAEEPAPVEETPVDTAPNAHGKAVSEVAKSDAVGGKNCNHGGAVSEAAKKDHGDKQAQSHGKSAGKGHGKGHNKP